MTHAPTTPDPIEIAMEAEASGRAPDGVAHAFLVEQKRLVSWQIASERAGVALKVLTGFAGVGAVTALALFTWRAHQADGLVVEPFSVPPAFVERGLTGEVLASQVLDAVAQLDRAASNAMRIGVSSSWSQASRVQVPSTGVSLGELDRLLRRWLGHETVLTGEAVLSGEAVTLSVRIGAGRMVSVSGPPAELTRLVAQAAEQTYRIGAPVPSANALMRARRYDEARAILAQVLAEDTPPVLRSRSQNLLGLLDVRQGRFDSARTRFRLAAQTSDRLRRQLPRSNLGQLEMDQGHPAAAAAAFRIAADDAGPFPPVERRLRRVAFSAKAALLGGDWTRAARLAAADVDRTIPGQFEAFPFRDTYVAALAGGHDLTTARRFAGGATPQTWAAVQDWPATLRALDQQALDFVPTPADGALRAQAMAGLGQVEAARGLAATLPADCYPCLLVRAELAADAGEAARIYAQAARGEPTVPFAFEALGRLQLARGQADAAIANARSAHRVSPNYPDALELWGEALLAKGDARGANAKFAAAAKLAPRWDRLNAKWREARAKIT